MTTIIPESLAEHTPRPGLRSATTAAALPSDLDVRPQMSPRLAASIARLGNPQQPIRTRTPTAMPASPTISRDAADAMLHLQRQLDETRAQLALVESNARTAAVQAAANFQQATADLQIQQLRDELARANAALRSPTPAQSGSDTASDLLTLNTVLSNVNAYVANPALVKAVALGAIVTVKNITDVCAALFRLVGSLHGAPVYEQYLSQVLLLPRQGRDEVDSSFAHSATCNDLDAAFRIADQLHPDTESVASTSASNDSDQHHVRANAAKLDAIFNGDVQPHGDVVLPLIAHIRRVDDLLLRSVRHLITAEPGSDVFDDVAEARTFVAAMAALLKSAGHGDDQTRDRRKECAFGLCKRYSVLKAAQGGSANFTFPQIVKIVKHDWAKRWSHVDALDKAFLTAELVVANIPQPSGGSRAAFNKEITQVIMKLAVEGTIDADTLSTELDIVEANYRHVLPTGSYTLASADDLSKVLGASRTTAVAAAALPVKPTPPAAKKGKGKGQPAGSQVPATLPPAAVQPPVKPPTIRRPCDHGADCRSVVLEWDPEVPGKTRMVTNCAAYHQDAQWRVLCQEARDRLAPASPKPPQTTPVLAIPTSTPHIPAASHMASLLAFERKNQTPHHPACVLVPACVAVHAEPTSDIIQAASDGYNSALIAYAAAERSVPSSIPSAQLVQFRAEHNGMSPHQYHHGILQLWEAYIASLAADLPLATGTALLATTSEAKKVLLLDSGSGSNLGPHLAPSATSELRAAPNKHRVQTAGGGPVSLDHVFDCEMWVRDVLGNLIALRMETHNVPALHTPHRDLFVVSTDILVNANDGEMVSRSERSGGSYMKLRIIDTDYSDGRTYLSEKINLHYQPLGAAEIPIAVREPDEPYLVAVLRSPTAPGNGPAALAVQLAAQAANQPPAALLPHTALVAVRGPDTAANRPEPTIPVGPRPHWDSDSLRLSRLLWYIADLNLSFRAARLVAIVDAYPLHDELDTELPPDRFYSAAPSYFTWDDRQSGAIYEDIFRRMIQRYSRQLVNGPPDVPFEWLDCDAAQVLAEVEQQLSMLVQGLVKARSDAVDGDGAMPLAHAPLFDTVTDGVPAPAVLPLHASLSEQSSPVVEWPGSLPTVSPITPLSHDDDSGADDTMSAAGADNADDPSAADPAVTAIVPPCDLSLIDAPAAGAAGTLAPVGDVPSLLDFLTLHELQGFYRDFLGAGYTSVADIPREPFQMFFTCTPLDPMRKVEKSRLLRALAGWALLRPSASGADALQPAGCKASLALDVRRSGQDGDDDDVAGDAARIPHKHAKCTPTPSAAAADTSVPTTDAATDVSVSDSGTGTTRAPDLSWLTEYERAVIEHHAWSADLGVCAPAVRIIETETPVAAPGPFGPLAGAGNHVPPAHARRHVSPAPARHRPTARHATAAAVAFVLCMCAHQLPGRPCLGRPAPGSDTCADCFVCSDGCPCVNSARPPFCSAVVPPARYQWPPGATKAVFLDPAAGTCSYSIARLTGTTDAISLAWDVLPPAVALADVVRAYPHLLPRLIYVQVVAGTLVTPELVTAMLSSMCDAAVTDVLEMMCGPCCTTITCRSGKNKNPHRRRIGGVLCPVTYDAAIADAFYTSLFDTVRFVHSANPRCSFILESPADSLLRELPQMRALLADIPATFVVHDHCVLACTPIDHWHGSTNKPTQYAVFGYDPTALPNSYRCAKLGCPHRLSLDADARHCLVQQQPAKRHRLEGQIRVCAESAARIPVGVFQFAFPLSARLHPSPTCGPMEPYPAAAPASPPVDLQPYGAYLSLRLPNDHRLRRLTPLTCVYNATTLHAVCGHTLRGQRLADSANQWQGFRMLNASGQLISAPNITAADVRLDAHCDICTRTQMQAAPSHSVHPRAGRQLATAVACPAPFGLADVSTSFLGVCAPWYSEPVPIPTWGQWLLPTESHPVSELVAFPALTPAVSSTLPDEGEATFTDSSDYDTLAPGRCPDSSDSDPEAEHDVDTVQNVSNISDRVYTHPNALGPDCRTFAALELLPDHMKKGRLAHFDIVHSELASPGHPLKAGVKHFLVCVDVGTLHLSFRPLRSTKCINRAYRELAIEQGWTTQTHVCHCVTDGEPGLMAPVRAAAAAMGQSFDTLPPYAANANHAGSHVIKHAKAAVRGFILGASEHPSSVINGTFEAFAWAQAALMHNITSIKGHPLHASPYRLANGINPIFNSVPFGAKVYIHIPKDARAGARNRGDNPAANRSEPAIAIGPRSQRDSLPVVLTLRNTTKASRTTYLAPDDSPLGVLGPIPPPVPVSAATHVDAAIASVSEQVQHNQRVRDIQRAAKAMCSAHDESIVLGAGPLIDRAKCHISRRCKDVVGLNISDALHSMFSKADGTNVPYRRADLQWDLDHGYLTAALAIPPDGTSEQYDSECAQAAHLACLALPAPELDPVTYACPVREQRARIDLLSTIVAMTDLPWKAYLSGPECAHVTAAWHREHKALIDLGAIVPLIPGSPDWEEAVKSKTTTPCRVLLDFKRDGTWKCRVVTRGDLEDKVALDGPDFHYYSNVSRQSTVRLAALRADRDAPRDNRTGGRNISTCDIANAFLQTTPFPETERRFLKIRNPIDGTVTYYRQLISVYGSCSASARWETTFSSWLCSPESEGGPGFVRGMNEPSAYYHPGRDLLMVLYTDDQLLDGYKEDIDWYYVLLRARFKIKEPKWLSPGNPIDHLGVGIFMTESHIYMTMENYIRSMNVVLQRDPSKFLHRKSPIPHKHEIVDMTPLSHTKEAFFVRALGMCSWISATVRLDGRYAQSRIAQYAATPCVGAYNALIHLLDYYTATATLCIRQSRSATSDWNFYSDSDMAGNPELVCKRRSQLGYIGLVGEAPIIWSSKCTSVQFAAHNVPAGFAWGRPVVAHPGIADNHADVSSAAAEIYAMGTATMDILALSYVCSESGIQFPRTFVLQVDNAAAQAFASQTTYSGRSRLRHVDARQEWVQALRDSKLVKAVHVDTTENLSDLFTKALDLATFTRFRKQLMHFHALPVLTH